jgi:hypothetical protein
VAKHQLDLHRKATALVGTAADNVVALADVAIEGLWDQAWHIALAIQPASRTRKG